MAVLELNRDNFSAFIEMLPLAIACFDKQKRYVAINQSCVELNGVPYEKTIGFTLAEVVPDLVETITPIFDAVFNKNESIENVLVEGKTPASNNIPDCVKTPF